MDNPWTVLGAPLDLPAGAVLWQEGDEGRFAVVLLEGELEVVRQSPEGEELVVRCLEPGEVAGEMACLDGGGHSASLRARSPCRLRRIEASELRRLLSERPELLRPLWVRQSQRVRHLTSRLADLGFLPVRQRVAARLLEILASAPGPELALTHQELAARVAATRESVSKALGSLAREGVLELSRGKIRVLDREGLERAARG
ncbi:MAG TPA: Crp/Fnr family transcriptional regulator [Candidatus Nitrosotenuis sp.]|jgi:CRP-like cAMP-binding protein|nr:Crp/Fnr family transcriptional regulator [Candidatus Nitrosotenuis sp.]